MTRTTSWLYIQKIYKGCVLQLTVNRRISFQIPEKQRIILCRKLKKNKSVSFYTWDVAGITHLTIFKQKTNGKD